MAAKKNILAICGSTRTKSVNKTLIHTVASILQDQFNVTLYDISSLPYFNQDVPEEETPSQVRAFRESIQQADGVLICTPEYVFSLPGVLKNAIEWTVSTTVFSDKPTALITASSSGHKAHESLVLIMNTLGIHTKLNMCLLLSGIKSKLNAQGEINDSTVLDSLRHLAEGFNS